MKNGYTVQDWSINGPSLEEFSKLRRQRDELVAALKPFAELLDGPLVFVGGGTRIVPSITVQMIKDAQAAIANTKGSA